MLHHEQSRSGGGSSMSSCTSNDNIRCLLDVERAIAESFVDLI